MKGIRLSAGLDITLVCVAGRVVYIFLRLPRLPLTDTIGGTLGVSRSNARV